MTPLVTTESVGTTTVLRMNHGKVNALDVDLLIAIREAFHDAAETSSVILTGNQRAFSAGLDLRQLLDSPLEYSDQLLHELTATCLTIFQHPRPVIAAIDGPAIAGGAMLALAADVRIMSDGVIGLPELIVGVPIPAVLLELARYVLGSQLARHVLSGRAVEPSAALAIGMIDSVALPEQLLHMAYVEAQTLHDVPPATFALIKRELHAQVIDRMTASDSNSAANVAQVWRSTEVRAAIAKQVDRLNRR